MYFSRRDMREPIDPGLAKQFEELLASEGSEEDVQKFLTENQRVLIEPFLDSVGFVCPKFKFGAEYVSDFLVANWGQRWEFTLIELEPKDVNAFNKDGTPARRLSQAIKQLSEWNQWIDMHRNYFIELIKPHVEDLISSLPAKSEFKRYTPYLHDLDYFNTSHVVIIGRRGLSFKDEQKRRSALSKFTGNNIDIFSYDWLLDLIQHEEGE